MLTIATVDSLRADLDAGRTTSVDLTEAALVRIADPGGEGARTFVDVFAERALESARIADRERAEGIVRSPLAGIPVSVKDLYDVAGRVTRAASIALAGNPPARADAPIVARLRAAGAVLVGTTNMTEFAYSGIGINPHFGTPRNPYDRATGRVPGGSSSGAAVSVTDGMAVVAIGSDTGGSVRIPAALCGIAGWKPTTGRIPIAGAFPLSTTLDTVGPLAHSLRCCIAADTVLADRPLGEIVPLPIAGLRLGVPTNVMLDDLDADVRERFEVALDTLERAGARVERRAFATLDSIAAINAKGGFSGPEALAVHEPIIARAGSTYDPRVLRRLLRGSETSGVDYVRLIAARREKTAAFDCETFAFDAILAPATPLVAPPIAALERDDAAFTRANQLMLRNTSAYNFLDRCAASLPIGAPGGPPVGLMLVGERNGDARLLAAGLAIEAALAGGAA